MSDFFYNGNKLISINSSFGIYSTYTYTGDLITGSINSDSSGWVIESTYEYDDNDRLIIRKKLFPENQTAEKYTYAYNADGTVSYEKYSGDFISQTNLMTTGKIYLNGNGIVLKVEEFQQGTLDNKIEYTYETKNTIFKNITGFNKLFIIGMGAINNPLTISKYDSNNALVSLYSRQFTYNSSNFPVSCSQTLNGNPESTIEYFYE